MNSSNMRIRTHFKASGGISTQPYLFTIILSPSMESDITNTDKISEEII
jgi:hypothetical protein